MQPSEHEDFDAVTTGEPAAPMTHDIVAPQPITVTEPATATPVAAAVSEPTASEAEAPVEAQPPKVKKEHGPFPKVPALIALVVLLVLGVAGLGVYASGLSSKNTQLKAQVAKLNANPQLAVQRQTDALISEVGKLMTLPSNETPTVANVSDAAKAKQQSAFFNNAENGDRVLMYVKAGEAILYRPSTSKIILVAPLTFNNTASTTPAAATKK